MKKFISVISLVTIMVLSVSMPVLAGGIQVSSGITVGAVITVVRSYVREPTAAFFDDTEFLSWIRMGVADIVARSQCLEFVDIAGIDSGATRIPYSGTSGYGIKSIMVFNPDDSPAVMKGLVRAHSKDFGKGSSSNNLGVPVYWTEEGGYLYFMPVPSSGLSLEITGVSNPRAYAMDSSNEIPTPAMYDPLLIYYVVGQAYYRAQQFSMGNLFMTQYYQGLAQFRRDYSDSRKENFEDPAK